MALPLKIKIRWGYVISFLMLLLSYFLIFFTINKLANQGKWINQSYTIIHNLESLKAGLIDAETGVRGYLITQDVRYLQPYNTGSKETPRLFNELQTLTSDNQTIKGKIDSLGILLKRHLVNMSEGIENFQNSGFVITDVMRGNKDPSKYTMDSIRLFVKDLQEKEHTLMNERSDKLSGFFTSTKVITITSLVIALFTVIYSVVIYNRENQAKENAAAQVQAYSKELEQGVNELKRVNVELEELKSIEKFAATGRIARTIAHEVRNPLTNISLASEQLKELLTQNEEADMLLEMVGRNVTRINQLVSELLNSTRFAQLECARTNINNVINEALDQARDRIGLKQIKVETYYETGLEEIMVDKEKVKFAFLNIILNAIESMQNGSGILQLKTHKHGDKCFVEIKDNGTGMEDETLQKMFEPYFTSKMKGNGLGLTNTQNIILNHKGNISVKSKPGAGSSFIIMLPCDQDISA